MSVAGGAIALSSVIPVAPSIGASAAGRAGPVGSTSGEADVAG
ncbi:hypothetical protein OG462_04130 [Streptomyces sp. NBC_01077]|nr:hypothetical protein OG462_04130 [Streptomyces sp. NBC_01077]